MTDMMDKFSDVTDGIDTKAIERWNLNPTMLKKLGEAYRMGWLHNVMSRITPLTLQRRDDYLAMSDIFIQDPETAMHVLDRFDADLELFCSVAEIHVTEHMNMSNVSPELSAHAELYQEIQDIFVGKFDIEARDPIEMLSLSPITDEFSNPFIKEFIDEKFDRNL